MATTREIGLRPLLDIQQTDGGWAYTTNSSWTEPTCYAILALRAASGPEPAIRRACQWLAQRQRRDGGWSPGPAVEQSTHVTSLSILALSELTGYGDCTDRGVHWLLTQSGAETSLLARTVRMVARTRSAATEHVGWPWFPGTAAWVIPTSLGICALAMQRHGKFANQVKPRLLEARSFLLSRRCPDHGWNHGGLFRDGEEPASYPETTGMALLALGAFPRGAGAVSGTIASHSEGGAGELEPSIRRGEQHYLDPRSSEGSNWLRLGLAAHSRAPEPPPTRYRDWTINHISLGIITQAAETGRNPFVSPSVKDDQAVHHE